MARLEDATTTNRRSFIRAEDCIEALGVCSRRLRCARADGALPSRGCTFKVDDIPPQSRTKQPPPRAKLPARPVACERGILRDLECSTTGTLCSRLALSVSSRQNAGWRRTEPPCGLVVGLSIFSSPLSTTPVKSSLTDAASGVWGDVSVEESSLRFNIKNLRKALGDTRSGSRYVTNIPGRGYCFAAQVNRIEGGEPCRSASRRAAGP